MTEEMREEFDALTREVMMWMDKKLHPHHTLVVTASHAELSEGVAGNVNKELRD